MKHFPANLFRPWPGDASPEPLPKTKCVQSLFGLFHDSACRELGDIVSTIAGIKQLEDEEIYDQLYRQGHFLYGFAGILGLAKVDHLLGILDAALDYAQAVESFDNNSLPYCIGVLANTARDVLDDYNTVEECKRDISHEIDECRLYLEEQFRAHLTATQPSSPAYSPARTGEEVLEQAQPNEMGATERALAAVAAAPTPPIFEFDDKPEELAIPTESLGLVSSFCEEAREKLTQMGQLIVELEDTIDPGPLVAEIFRAIHTLKGGSRLLQVRKLETLSHELESLLGEVRNGSRPVDEALIDLLLDGRACLETMVEEVASNGPIRTPILPCLEAVQALQAGRTLGSASEPAEGAKFVNLGEGTLERGGSGTEGRRQSVAPDSIRVPTQKLDVVLNAASEIFINRIRLETDVAAIGDALRQSTQTAHRLTEFGSRALTEQVDSLSQGLHADLHLLLRRLGLRVPAKDLNRLFGEFREELRRKPHAQDVSASEDISFDLLSIKEVWSRLQGNVQTLEQLSGRLQTGAMSFRMVPLAQLLDRFPTQVREIARQLGKKVRLEVTGGDTELDRVLVNGLTDPILHLLRNAIDHGIESPEERRLLGKPEAGQIGLNARYEGSHAVLEITDDGRGISAEVVLEKAIERGLVDRERAANLDEVQVLDFIFEPGFSTAAQVSELSGRGVGMDVVKMAIVQAQGSISVQSRLGQGTVIAAKLPLTLAVVGIVLVEAGANQFAFPIFQVERIIFVEPNEVRRLSDSMVYNYRGRTLPVTTLSRVMKIPSSSLNDETRPMVILAEGEERIGVLVDAILGQEEVLIKNLGSMVKRVPYVMGCTILSDSRLVLILNTSEILAAQNKALPEPSIERDPRRAVRAGHRIFVIDDSVIQRRRLGEILVQAGYDCDLAENGFDAIKVAKERKHAVFCVDLLMPVMDGFEFIEQVRRVPGREKTPVVVITGRDSMYERERTEKLGINDYMTKPVDADELISRLDHHCVDDGGGL
jgi:chemotaxis protein histidine kinase CheA/ActR/RegA family two-component response regulator